MRICGVTWSSAVAGISVVLAFSPHTSFAPLAMASSISALQCSTVLMPMTEPSTSGSGLRVSPSGSVEALSLHDTGPASFDPEFDESLAVELAELPLERGVVFVTKTPQWPEVERRVRAVGYTPIVRGKPFHNRVIFLVDIAQPRLEP